MQTKTFYLADYIIFGAIMIVSIGIGFFHAFVGRRKKTTLDFHLGNRKMAIIPVAVSLLISFEASIMMLGTPAETYVFGIQYMMANFGWVASNLIAIKIMVPLIHPLKITSSYEYLELRFRSRAVRLFGTMLGIINFTMYMGIVLFGPAIALEAVMGFPQYASISIVALASVMYTSMGGFKAVIWTDVFQSLVMLTGMLAVLIKGTIVAGGIKSTWTIANDNGRLNFFQWNTDITTRHTFWNLFIGSTIRRTGLFFNQTTVQRISSTPTLKDARKVMLVMSPPFLIITGMACYEGIIAYSYYHTLRCDPLASKQISNPNQIIPHMVMDIFDGLQGMPGLFIASLFCATLSTLASGLSGLSALFWNDIVKPHTKPMSELKATIISKVAVIMFGMISTGVAFLVSTVGGTLTQITATILSTIGGPLSGLFLLGCFCPWANSKGAFVGTLSGIAIITWIATGQYTSPHVRKPIPLPSAPVDRCFVPDSNIYNLTLDRVINITIPITDMTTGQTSPVIDTIPSGINYLYSIAYTWLHTIAILTVIMVGSLASFITGRTKPEESNPMFLISAVDEFLFYLPKSLKTILKFGYSYTKPEVYDPDAIALSTTAVVENSAKEGEAINNLNTETEALMELNNVSNNNSSVSRSDHKSENSSLLKSYDESKLNNRSQ